VQVVSTLKKEKAALAAEFRAWEAEARRRTKKIAEMTRERGEVKDRVEKSSPRLDMH
jgi:hypothetical protein